MPNSCPKRTWGVRLTKSTHLQDMTAIIVTRGVELMHVRVKCKRLVHLPSFEKPAICSMSTLWTHLPPTHRQLYTLIDHASTWRMSPTYSSVWLQKAGETPTPVTHLEFSLFLRVLNHVSPSFCWVWFFTSTPTN